MSKDKKLPDPITLTRFKWSATYQLPSGEHKKIESVAQCTSSEQCLKLVERMIVKIGGPNAERRVITVEPLDKYIFRPKSEIPAILLPTPLPFEKAKTTDEVAELNKKFSALACFTEFPTKRKETDNLDPFYKALPKDVA